MKATKPIIKLISDTKEGLQNFRCNLNNSLKYREIDLINNYPVVYIHGWKRNGKFEIYVGESGNFFRRTKEHYDLIESDQWEHNLKNNKAFLYVITHEYFNKSLTKDIENKLIKYLSSSKSVAKVYNVKSNPQNNYFSQDKFDRIFAKIWQQLRMYDNTLFLSESIIESSAIFKASPLHKLNEEQLLAKEKMLESIDLCLSKDVNHQLIFVRGNSGTGKTVLMSSVFYDFINMKRNSKNKNPEVGIIVNNKEQVTIYEEIVDKLDLNINGEKMVFKSTQFINLFKNKKNSPAKRTKKYDVLFVDEAHLLLTRKNQAYTENEYQLTEIMKYAKVVVAIFDRRQIMNAEQYLGKEEVDKFINMAKQNDSFIELNIQMRMKTSKELERWIRAIYTDGVITKAPSNREKYEIKIFDTPKKLESAIRKKASSKKTPLSRLIATYDWKYRENSRPKNKKYWDVTIGDWSMPWNYELSQDLTYREKQNIKKLPWAQQPHTINEVGSIYTIHGFDLNYAGVIIGPSIKYRNGKILFDSSLSYNDKAKQKRKLPDGTSKSFGEEFLQNELGVLLTRGVNGLYIYACDDALREQLKKSL